MTRSINRKCHPNHPNAIHPVPSPLGCANGCNNSHYILSTQICFFPTPNHPLARPTVSTHPRMAVSCIVDGCLTSIPNLPPAALPYYTLLPLYPAPFWHINHLPAHLEDHICKLIYPGTMMAKPFFLGGGE